MTEQRKKGQISGNAGKGRPKGAVNKVTAQVKDMVIGALSELGGTAYLVRQGEENPKAFLALVGRVIPVQVTGEGDGPLQIVISSADSRL